MIAALRSRFRDLLRAEPPPRPWRPVWLRVWHHLQSEVKLHPHVPEERANLFLAFETGTTEIEVLNGLHATIIAHKPRCVLEIGASAGLGTLALASACKANGFGKVHSVELDRVTMEAPPSVWPQRVLLTTCSGTEPIRATSSAAPTAALTACAKSVPRSAVSRCNSASSEAQQCFTTPHRCARGPCRTCPRRMNTRGSGAKCMNSPTSTKAVACSSHPCRVDSSRCSPPPLHEVSRCLPGLVKKFFTTVTTDSADAI